MTFPSPSGIAVEDTGDPGHVATPEPGVVEPAVVGGAVVAVVGLGDVVVADLFPFPLLHDAASIASAVR